MNKSAPTPAEPLPAPVPVDPPWRTGFALPPDRDVWVFGYGSLMWNPGFDHVERQPALVRGWHRRFCIYSFHYRGTPERPGLVLGLDRGGSCRGMAFRVPADRAEASLSYLWEREMISAVYRPMMVKARLPTAVVQACTFVSCPGHDQYCGRVDPGEMARLIAQGHGRMGPNIDYVENTLRHLQELGIADPAMEEVARRVRSLLPPGGAAPGTGA